MRCAQLADLDYLEDREKELDSRRRELLSATLSKLEKATEVSEEIATW